MFSRDIEIEYWHGLGKYPNKSTLLVGAESADTESVDRIAESSLKVRCILECSW